MTRKRTATRATQLPLQWIDVSAPWTIDDIGAPLLASLAEGLYRPEEVLREYVQNAIDAYVDFKMKTGRSPRNSVQIFIDPSAAEVHVFDEGIGMDEPAILQAKKIAVSPKLERPNEFVGFRGIGIWSGLSACDTLILETTKLDVPLLFRLTIDFKGIREHVYESIPINELLEGRIHIERQESKAEDHYTHLRLLNVERERYGKLLDIVSMTRYAEQHLPVPFDPQWPYAGQVVESLDNVPWSAAYELTINGEQVYRRFPPETEIKPPEFFEILDDERTKIAYAWVSETKRRGQHKAIELNRDRGEVSNLAVRIKNFAVGPRGLYAAPDAVLDSDNLSWYVGEIYITDTDVKPDTNRREFQRSFRSDKVIAALRMFYTSVATRARGWSAEVNALAAADSVIAESAAVESLLEERASLSVPLEIERVDSKIAGHLRYINGHKEKLEDALNRANAQDTGDESPRVQAQRRYLRKPNVKSRIELAIGRITDLDARVRKIAPSAVQIESTGQQIGDADRKQKRSSARTARSRGTPVTPHDALSMQAATRTSEAAEQRAVDSEDSGQTVKLELVISAFLAAVAAVVGEDSETYHQIEERLPDELRRRGIDV